jgi:inorganic pyrophosphatase
MKYIKLFENFKSKAILKQFCKDNLAYLIDYGYISQIVDDDMSEKS